MNTNTVAFVDDSDYQWLLDSSKWYLSPAGYVYGYFGNDDKLLLHRVILGVQNEGRSTQVDHIDFNPLNCQRNNLRLVSNQQNSFHQRVRNTNTSGYKGVSRNTNRSKTKPWRAYIVKDNKQFAIGTFSSAEDAARAYDKYAQLLFGNFAFLNFPQEDNAHFNENISRKPKPSSKHKGIHKNRYGKWICRCNLDGVRVHVGSFSSEEAAYIAQQEYINKWQQQSAA